MRSGVDEVQPAINQRFFVVDEGGFDGETIMKHANADSREKWSPSSNELMIEIANEEFRSPNMKGEKHNGSEIDTKTMLKIFTILSRRSGPLT